MFDWKILGATFAALLVVSTLFLGGFGIPDFFSDILEKISQWLGSSPFGGIQGKTIPVKIRIQPTQFVLSPAKPINITLDSFEMENFQGEMEIYFQNSTLIFTQEKLRIESNLQNFIIPEVQIQKLWLQTSFQVSAQGSNITSDNGTLEVWNFKGVLSLENKTIYFSGNVTKIKGEEWEIS